MPGPLRRPRLRIPAELSRTLLTFGDWQGWRASLDSDVPDAAIFRTGLRVLCDRGPVLLAICLNNGYYKRSRIRRLIQATVALSPRVTIFFTDGPAKHNYLALGRSAQYATNQTRKQRNQLMNSCLEAITVIRETNPEVNVGFINWADIYSHMSYKSTYVYLMRLYEQCKRFYDEVRQSTRDVLMRDRRGEDEEAIVDVGVQYSIEELAFLLAYEHMVGEARGLASEEFVYLYYLRWEILENLVNGAYDGVVRSSVGFAVLTAAPDNAAASLDRSAVA